MCAAYLGWQGEWRTVVAGGNTSSGSIAKVAGCVLFLLAHEANERRTVVAKIFSDLAHKKIILPSGPLARRPRELPIDTPDTGF